jgi:hypothetical protein
MMSQNFRDLDMSVVQKQLFSQVNTTHGIL